MKSAVVPVGTAAPDFTLPAVDGRDRSLGACRGHKVVLIFYRGHWCGACRQQLAGLREGVLTLEDCGATVFAISSEPLARARESAERDGLAFTILCDESLAVIDRYGVRHVDEPEGRAIARPSVFLLDRAGIVRFAHVGEDPLDRPGLRLIQLGLEAID